MKMRQKRQRANLLKLWGTTSPDLGPMADAAAAAAKRPCAAVDDSLEFIDESNARIERMEHLHDLRRCKK